MRSLLGKVLSKSIETDQEISIIHGLDDPTEVSCGKGTVFEINENYLFLEEHYHIDKEEHIIYHLFKLSDIQYIGAA